MASYNRAIPSPTRTTPTPDNRSSKDYKAMLDRYYYYPNALTIPSYYRTMSVSSTSSSTSPTSGSPTSAFPASPPQLSSPAYSAYMKQRSGSMSSADPVLVDHRELKRRYSEASTSNRHHFRRGSVAVKFKPTYLEADSQLREPQDLYPFDDSNKSSANSSRKSSTSVHDSMRRPPTPVAERILKGDLDF